MWTDRKFNPCQSFTINDRKYIPIYIFKPWNLGTEWKTYKNYDAFKLQNVVPEVFLKVLSGNDEGLSDRGTGRVIKRFVLFLHWQYDGGFLSVICLYNYVDGKYRISVIFCVGKFWRKWCSEVVLKFHQVLFSLFQGLCMETYSRVYFSLCLFLEIIGGWELSKNLTHAKKGTCKLRNGKKRKETERKKMKRKQGDK